MVTRIHPQCALTRPLCFQDHLMLAILPPVQNHLAWDNSLDKTPKSTVLKFEKSPG